MEWSVSSGNSRYKPTLEDRDGSIHVSSMSRDGMEVHPPDAAISADSQQGRLSVEVDGNQMIAHVARDGDSWWINIDGRAHVVNLLEQGSGSASKDEGALTAPMPGTILDLMVKEGQRVREGQALMVLEAMKMEHRITSPKSGEITRLHYGKGDRVDMGSVLVEIGD